MGGPLWLWWELVTSHVVIDMDVVLVMVSSSCELGSLLASGAGFGSIGVGGNCIGGRSIKGFVASLSFQTVGGSIHSSNWHLGRWIPLGNGVPWRDGVSMGDGGSSASIEALVEIRHGTL